MGDSLLSNYFKEFQGSSDEEDERFQNHLFELVHASTCLHNSVLFYACPLPFCAYTKHFLNHLNECILDNHCPQLCYKSKMLFNHWKECIKIECNLCNSVKRKLNDHFLRSSYEENATYKSKASNEIEDLFTNLPPNYVEKSRELTIFKEPYQIQNTQVVPMQNERPENLNNVLTKYLNPLNLTTSNNTKSCTVVSNSSTSSNIFEPLDFSNNSSPVVRQCRRCKYHGQVSQFRNHTCPYKECNCEKCIARNARKNRHNPYKRPDLSWHVPEVATEVTIDSPLPQTTTMESANDDIAKIRHEDKVDWIQYSNLLCKDVMVEGGRNFIGDISYIGRGYYNGHLLPAGIFPTKIAENTAKTFSAIIPKNTANISTTFDGKAHALDHCEALIVGDFEWKKVEFGNIPGNAIFSGVIGEDVQYTGRANYNSLLVTGRVSRESGCLYIPYGASEVMIQNYEILVDKSSANVVSKISKESTQSSPSATATSTSRDECTICYESPVVGIFKECLHACLCINCIDIVNRKKEINGKVRCPVCRTLCNKAEKFFMP